jgi:hypothetical protein
VLHLAIKVQIFSKKGKICIAYNGYGLLLCGYSVIRQPELLLTDVKKDEDIFSCRDLFAQPGQ